MDLLAFHHAVGGTDKALPLLEDIHIMLLGKVRDNCFNSVAAQKWPMFLEKNLSPLLL